MYDEIIQPSSNYADLIINNDGVKNLAIDVLTCVLRDELAKENSGKIDDYSATDEFREEILQEVFAETHKK